MGGGDLNLKKSWHPSTLRNIERVWKAEQKHEVEQQKIEQLQKELAEERAREEIQAFAEDQGVVKKKDERLDWMYQGPAAMVNRDEYLLGRKIDKTLETLTQMEKGGEPEKEEGVAIANNSMFNRDDLSGTATVDLATKIREDPLFSIMKKEKEERKNLLTNPVKMKQLQEMLKASLGKSKSKKSKKNKKKKHHDSDSDDEKQYIRQKKHQDSDSAEESRYKRQKKYQDSHFAEEKQYKRQKKQKTSYSSESEEDQDLHTNHQSKKSNSSNGDYSSSSKRYSKYKNDVPESDKRKYKNFHAFTDNKEADYHSRSNSGHKGSRHESYQERNGTDHYSSKKRSSKYELDEPKMDKKHKKSHLSSNSRKSGHHSSNQKKSRVPTYSESSPDHTENGSERSHYSKQYKSKPHQGKDPATDKKKKLDASEKERLLKEMQENAKWREEQRKRNTQRYKEEEEREKEMTVEKIKSDAFLKPLLSKAAGKGSLENRLKQKIFSIQRSSSAMDKNFAKRD